MRSTEGFRFHYVVVWCGVVRCDVADRAVVVDVLIDAALAKCQWATAVPCAQVLLR